MKNNKLVGSFKEACKIMKYKPESAVGTKNIPSHFAASVSAHFQMMVIIEAQNKVDDFSVDYRPGNGQCKYSPWPDVDADDSNPSGVGFSTPAFDDVHTLTYVGSRLVVGTRERALQLFEKHKKLYAEMWFIPTNHIKALKAQIKKSKK